MLRLRRRFLTGLLSSPIASLYRILSAAAPAVSANPSFTAVSRSCILSHLPSSPAASPILFPLHRLISTATAAVPPNPSFTVVEYLVDTCGLTRPQALKASAKLSHVKSPTNPDAVLAFLAGLGLSGANVAAVVVKDPLLLCAGVERTLAPVVVGLTGLGLSSPEIARLVLLQPSKFRCRTIISKLNYYLPLFGSFENLHQALKCNINLFTYSLERIVKPNVAILQECGLGDCDIAKLARAVPRMLTAKLECVQAMVACAEGLGVPRGSAMFRHALHAVAFIREDKIAAQVENLKNTFRWSDAEVGIAVSKLPIMLRRCKNNLQSRSEFLISEVGLEPAYIAHRPALLTYSFKGRLRPRYYVVKFLKENGLLDRDRSYYTTVMVTEKVFMEKYIFPHNEAAPHLAEDYATACRGEVPPRFIFA